LNKPEIEYPADDVIPGTIPTPFVPPYIEEDRFNYKYCPSTEFK